MPIDPKTFEYKESVWGDIFIHLKNKGFDVYSPDTHVGECVSPYIVVKYIGGTRIEGLSSDDDIYGIQCYVPQMSYSSLEPMIMSVRAAMKELYPLVVPYGSQTPSYYDDSVKGHYVEVDYKNHKKML